MPAMVSELFSGVIIGDLIYSIRIGETTLTESQILDIARDIFEQLVYLNERGLNHGDVHSNNVLYNRDRVVLIDVTAQEYSPEEEVWVLAEVNRTTPEYWMKAIDLGIDPSILLQKKDIYDTAEIILDLMNYEYPSLLDMLSSGHSIVVSSKYPTVNKLVNSAINIDISQRPSASDILEMIM